MTAKKVTPASSTDDRVKKHGSRAQRGAVAEGRTTRGPRAAADDSRVLNEGTALSRAERRAMIRNEWTQSALPPVPPLPGFHLCWLSSTSTYDTVEKRMRFGYRPVMIDELPGYDSQYRANSGSFEGCVSCNEMVLFKIPMALYQEIMVEFHHDMPNEEESKIKAAIEGVQQSVSTKSGKAPKIRPADDDEGFSELASHQQVPVFN